MRSGFLKDEKLKMSGLNNDYNVYLYTYNRHLQKVAVIQ